MSIESDISDSIKPSLVLLVFIFLELIGIILNLRIIKVAKINGSFQVLYFSQIFQKYLNVIFMLRSSLILILILITSPFPLQISPASSIVIRNPFNREQLGTKHCWLHHSIPRKRSTMIEREGYRRSSAKSVRKNVHFPRHSSRHPIGRRVPEADTAFARECLSRSRKAAERESEEEGRRREKKKEREKGPWWNSGAQSVEVSRLPSVLSLTGSVQASTASLFNSYLLSVRVLPLETSLWNTNLVFHFYVPNTILQGP